MTSKIVVNNIEADTGVSTVTFGSEISASKIVTSSGEFTVGTGASVYSPATNVLALGTNNAERVRVTSDGDLIFKTSGTMPVGKFVFREGSDDSFSIRTTGANGAIEIYDEWDDQTRLHIDTSGNVGIGTDNPGYKLDLYGNPGSDAGSLLRLKSSVNDDNGIIHEQANGQKWFTGQETTNPNDYEFWNYNGSTWNNVLHLDSNGDVNVSDGNLVIGTSGHGISFAATGGPSNGTGTSELLDDYEEGTWTPALGSGGWTITTNYARYTKIGDTVRAQAYVSLTGTGGSSQFYINGLPYLPPVDAYSIGTADFGYPGKYGIYCRTTPNSSRVEFYYPQASTSLLRGALAGTDVGAGYLVITLVYNT